MDIWLFYAIGAFCISFSGGERLYVATALVRSFPPDTGVYTSVRSEIPFEYFTEKPLYVLKSKLTTKQFTSVVNTLMKSHGLTDEVKDTVLKGLYARVNEAVIRQFKFSVGGPCTMMYGHVATMKGQDGTMDLAVAIQQADFKLEPEEIYHRDVKRFFGIEYGVDRWVERRERTLSVNDREYLYNFLQGKALAGFNKLSAQFADYCSVDSCE